jgi:small GTP-binding protein
MSTIGVDFKTKDCTLNSKAIRMQIWDTAGQERFRNITNSYYKGANGIAIVYDVTNRQSFDTVTTWIEEITKKTTNTLNVIIANKIDMTNHRVVSQEEGQRLADSFGLSYFETSAKDDRGVNDVFEFMTQQILNTVQQSADYVKGTKGGLALTAEQKQKKDKCC